MRIVLQRVSKGSVSVNDIIIAQITKGYVVMLGVQQGDMQKDIDFLVHKLLHVRLFESDGTKFDQNLSETNGEVCIISQFTVFADFAKNKPYFGGAERPSEAEKMYDKFIESFKNSYKSEKVKSGKFAAKMLVEIHNDGPVTVILDSRIKF